MSWFDKLSASRRSRIVLALAFALFHLAMFDCAGHRKVDLPFNSAPGEAPAYSDINAPAVTGAVRQPHHWSRLVVSRWDAEHYIGFAVRGLAACPKDGAPGAETDRRYLECGLGWRPAFGEIGGLVSRITGIAPDYALLVLALLAAFAANLLWTSAPFVKRLGDREALGALIAFNLFPSAFHLVAPYPESTVMMFALAGFVALATERWVLAGALVGAATAFGSTAGAYSVAFALAALFAAYQRRHAKAATDAAWWKPLLGIPLCCWSWLVQLLVLKIAVGDAFAYARARDAFGDSHHYFRLLSPTFLLRAISSMHYDGLVLIACVAIVALAFREVAKRMGPTATIYLGIASLLAVILGASDLLSHGTEIANTWGLNRTMLLCPITFCCAGVLLRKHAAAFVFWLALSVAIYWHVELCSYVTQGNMELCPCLGRFQIALPIQS